MKLSANQALSLFLVLKGTINIAGFIGGHDRDQRLKLLNEILNQQGNVIEELSETKIEPKLDEE